MNRLFGVAVVVTLLTSLLGCSTPPSNPEAAPSNASETAIDSTSDAFGNMPLAARNARLLGLDHLRFEPQRDDHARVTWRIPRFDPGVSHVDFPGDGPIPLWLSEPVEVRRAPGVLVFGGLGSDLDGLLRDGRTARAQVLKFIPGWDGMLVVEAPTSSAGLEKALNGQPGDYEGVAAITSSPDGSRRADTPVHVFVNAGVYAEMPPAAARIVMTHEVVHVATKAPTVDVPLWWAEGLADYVAFSEVDRRDRAAASRLMRISSRQLADDLAANGVPDGLPDESDFSGAERGATYESARRACQTLAERARGDGRAALAQFQKVLAAGVSERRAVPQVFGISYQEFIEDWQQHLAGDG